MPYSETLAGHIREVLHSMNIETEEKKMFGGLAFMYKSKMAFGIIKEELMVRILKGSLDEMLSISHTREMDFTGRPAKGMIYVTPEGLRSPAELRKWIEIGINYVEKEGLAKPAKSPKSKK